MGVVLEKRGLFHVKHCREINRAESGLDWLTLTISADHPSYFTLASDWQSFVEWNKVLGNEVKAWGASGYNGLSCGNRAIGYRDDGAMLRASGPSANEALDTMWRPYCGVPRVDLQLTLWETKPGPNPVIEALYHHVSQLIKGGSIKTQKTSLVRENNGGMTLYIGSRSSEVFIRVYNKGAETGEIRYYNAIRYEIEYKGRPAKKVAAMLAKMKRESRAESIAETVAVETEKRGVKINGVETEGKQVLYFVDKVETDHDKQLAWLSSQVAPTVQRLINAGLTFDVLLALGLDKPEWGKLLPS